MVATEAGRRRSTRASIESGISDGDRWRVAVIGILLGSLLMAGCGRFDWPPPPDTTGLTPPTTVATPGAPLAMVIGDSITTHAGDRVSHELLGRGWNTSVLARPGATIDEMRPFLLGAATLDPAALVIQLGSNDVGFASDPTKADPDDWSEAVSSAIDRIGRTLDEVKEVPCVVWVNVTDWTNFFGYDTRVSGLRFNDALARAAAEDPRLHVVDYAALFRPDTPEREQQLREDFDIELLHPTSTTAVQRWVTAVGDAVDTACRPT